MLGLWPLIMYRDEELRIPPTQTSAVMQKPMHAITRAIGRLPPSVARGLSATLNEGAFGHHPTRIQFSSTKMTDTPIHNVRTYYVQGGNQIIPRTGAQVQLNEDRIGVGYMPSRVQVSRLLSSTEIIKYNHVWKLYNNFREVPAEISREVLKMYQNPEDSTIPVGTRSPTSAQRKQIQVTRTIDWETAHHATGLFLSDSIFALSGTNGFIVPSVTQFAVAGAKVGNLLAAVPALALHMPNLDTVYMIAGTNDVLQDDGQRVEIGKIKQADISVSAGHLTRTLREVNSRKLWEDIAPKVRKVFICIPFLKEISPNAKTLSQQRAKNLNTIYRIVASSLLNENDRDDENAIAKFVRSEFLFHSTPDGIHIQALETPAAIAAFDDEMAKLRQPETRRDGHFKQISYNRLASHHVFVCSRLRSIVHHEHASRMNDRKAREEEYEKLTTEQFLMGTKLVLQTKVEINTEIPMDAMKLITPNMTRQINHDSFHQYKPQAGDEVCPEFQVQPLEMEGIAGCLIRIGRAAFTSVKSETEFFRLWDKKFLEIQEQKDIIPLARRILEMLKAEKVWTDFQEAARRRSSGGANLKVLEQMKFGEAFSMVMIFGGKKFNQGPLSWNWSTIGPRGLQTAVLLLSVPTLQRFVNESMIVRAPAAKQAKNIYNYLELDDIRKQMTRHISHFLITIMKRKAMGLIDLCVHLGIHEKLLVGFTSTDFATQLVGYAPHNIKLPPKQWYLDNPYILHPGSYACGTEHRSRFKLIINSPLELESIDWSGGICVQQSGVTETLKQGRFLESISGRSVTNQLSMIENLRNDPTVHSYLEKEREMETQNEALLRQRQQAEIIRTKAIREEQEAKQRIRLKKAQKERKLEEQLEILRVEMDAIAAQTQENAVLTEQALILQAGFQPPFAQSDPDDTTRMEEDLLLNEDLTIPGIDYMEVTESTQTESSKTTKSARRVGSAKPKSRKPFTNIEGGTNSQDEEEEVVVHTPDDEVTVVVAPARCTPSVLVASTQSSSQTTSSTLKKAKRMNTKKSVRPEDTGLKLFTPDPIVSVKRSLVQGTSSQDEEIVPKKVDQRVTPPKEIVVSRMNESTFSQSTTNVVTSTPFASSTRDRPGTLIPEERSYMDVIEEKRQEDIAAGRMKKPVEIPAGFFAKLGSGEPSKNVNAVPAGAEIHETGPSSGKSSGGNAPASNTDGAYKDWERDFERAYADDSERYCVITMGEAPPSDVHCKIQEDLYHMRD